MARGSQKRLRPMHATIAGAMSELPAGAVSVRYPVRPYREAWALPDGPVPESTTHDAAVRCIWQLLDAWVKRKGLDALVVRNLAIRWMQDAPRVGIDPDVALIAPAPAEARLSSLRLWEQDRVAPRLCFEVVSESHPYKDYGNLHDRYAAMGTAELIVFGPLLSGPAALGGPVPLQIWRRDPFGILERVHFGEGPAFSAQLGAWLHVDGEQLHIADDADGLRRWRTIEEDERAEKEHERAEKEHERAEKERERAEKERERAEKERERAEREAAQERLAALERRLADLERK